MLRAEHVAARAGWLLVLGFAACSSHLDLGHDVADQGDPSNISTSPSSDLDASIPTDSGGAVTAPSTPTGSTCVGAPCFAGPVETLATSMGNARGLVVDADNVFWAATTGQALMITPKDGSETIAIPVPLGGPFRVVADDTNVYFTSSVGGYVAATPKAQRPSDAPRGPEGVRTLLADQPEPWALVVTSEGVYFSDNQAGTVKLVASDGSSVQTLVTGMSSGGELAVDADFLYYTDSGLGEVHAVDRVTKVDTLLVDGLEHPVAPVPRGDVLYFLELGTEAANYEDGRLLSMPRTGGLAVPLIEQLDFPSGLAADSAAVYVCTRGSATNSPHGRIMRLADDGELSTLAVDQAEPFAIAVDGNAVYWTTDADNALRAIKR